MKKEDIKEECEKLYSDIRYAEQQLQILRDICEHEDTFIGTYSWREGSYQQGKICKYCNKFIEPTF